MSITDRIQLLEQRLDDLPSYDCAAARAIIDEIDDLRGEECRKEE